VQGRWERLGRSLCQEIYSLFLSQGVGFLEVVEGWVVDCRKHFSSGPREGVMGRRRGERVGWGALCVMERALEEQKGGGGGR
jgi:hypothetical protein